MREGSGGPVGPADALAVPSAMSATHARRASRSLLCAASSPTRPGSSPARRDASLAGGWATRAQLPSHQHPAGQLGRERAARAQAPGPVGVGRRRRARRPPQALRGRRRARRPCVAEAGHGPLRRCRPPARGCRAEPAALGAEGGRAALPAPEDVPLAAGHAPRVARLPGRRPPDATRGGHPGVGPVAPPRVAREHAAPPIWQGHPCHIVPDRYPQINQIGCPTCHFPDFWCEFRRG